MIGIRHRSPVGKAHPRQRCPAHPARCVRACLAVTSAGEGRPGRPHPPASTSPSRSGGSRVSRVSVTPVAFADPPLLNVVGVHQPYARAIVQPHTDSGLLGLETYADEAHIARPPRWPWPCRGSTSSTSPGCAAAPSRPWGVDLGRWGEFRRDARHLQRCRHGVLALRGRLSRRAGPRVPAGPSRTCSAAASARRSRSATCSSSGPDTPATRTTAGAKASPPRPDGAASRRMVDDYGFRRSVSGWAFEPRARSRPSAPSRRLSHHRLIDPNGGWTVDTSVQVAKELDGVLEYLEDPTWHRRDGGGRPADRHPLATNMCVIAFEHLAPAVRRRGAGGLDHHLWGGLRRSALLGGICDTFGMGLSMHSTPTSASAWPP